jgi:hypothetical protein
VAEHLIEYWEMAGDKRVQWTPACLPCRWIGSDGTRSEAEEEARMHERGELPPWIIPKGEHREWTPDKNPIEDFRMR